MDIEKLKFPTGEYLPNKYPDKKTLEEWILDIESFPQNLENLLKDVSVEKINWKYRPDGWSVKQVIHHCADSHMNALIRFKLTLTENKPIIRPYFEDKWAKLDDVLDNDISGSLMLLKGLHQRWVVLLKHLTKKQLQLKFIHPEKEKAVSLIENIGIYSWHCKHHLAHIKSGIGSNGKHNEQ